MRPPDGGVAAIVAIKCKKVAKSLEVSRKIPNFASEVRGKLLHGLRKIMKNEEKKERERVAVKVAEMIRNHSFTLEFKAKKRPRGLVIVIEVTEEEMEIMRQSWRRRAGQNETE